MNKFITTKNVSILTVLVAAAFLLFTALQVHEKRTISRLLTGSRDNETEEVKSLEVKEMDLTATGRETIERVVA